jgi:cytochrome c
MSSSSRKARRRTRKEEQGNEGTKNRDHPTTVWRGRKNLYCFSAIWNFEQAGFPGTLPSAIVHALVTTASRIGDDGIMTSKISRIIALVILLFGGPAFAQPDARRGLSLARENCEQCHAIDNTSESPLAAAPPFRELHLKYAVSDLQRPLTQGPHTKFRFEPSQIEALMAYLKTLGR